MPVSLELLWSVILRQWRQILGPVKHLFVYVQTGLPGFRVQKVQKRSSHKELDWLKRVDDLRLPYYFEPKVTEQQCSLTTVHFQSSFFEPDTSVIIISMLQKTSHFLILCQYSANHIRIFIEYFMYVLNVTVWSQMFESTSFRINNNWLILHWGNPSIVLISSS